MAYGSSSLMSMHSLHCISSGASTFLVYYFSFMVSVSMEERRCRGDRLPIIHLPSLQVRMMILERVFLTGAKVNKELK